MEITNYITECIEKNVPVTFAKFGDGEFECVFGNSLNNCDMDRMTVNLKVSLYNSFKYIVENTQNSYIGLWHNLDNKKIWENIVNKNVNWAKYHTIIFDKTNDADKVKLYKTIKMSKFKKIIICNECLIKSKILLNIDEMVIVPFNSWFDSEYNTILDTVKNLIAPDENNIIITCCGMSAKVLICDLLKSHPNNTYIDFGSALDLICTKHDSRGDGKNYSYLVNLLNECLNEEWYDDEKYKDIYNLAKEKTGLHLR
jgi:hypothetical protein